MSVGAIRAGRAMVEIFADSSMLARGLASAQSKMARFAQTIRRLGSTQVVLGVGMAAPIAAAVRQYAQLEQRINTVRSLTGGTVAQMRGLTQAIRQIGMDTGRPFTEIADGMGELSRAGVGLQSLGKATRVIADFSRAAGVDMARASNIGVEILTEFGLTMEHLPRVADVLQEMANATVSTVEDLSDGFRYAGQTARLFGLSLEQAGAAIAYLQQSGLPSTTAGTSLNQMLLQMVQNLDKLEAAVGGLRGANGEFLPFATILGKVQQHIADMPGPERIGWLNKMFDVRGMRGADGLLKNIEAWMALTQQAEGSMGSSKRKANEMSKAFIVSFEQMRNGLVDFSYSIGEVLDADLRSAFQTLAGLATGLGPFIKANADAVRSVAKFAAVLVVSGATFFTVGVSLQLLAFAFEGFVKAGLAAYAPINGLIGLGKMLGVAFTSTAAQVTRAGSVIAMSITGLYAAVSRPIDASVAAVTALGSSFVSMSRTVQGAVGRAVASMGALNRAFIASIPAAGSAVRGAAAAAPRAVGAAAAGAAAATAGAGRAAAAPVAAAAAAQGAVAARGPLPMIAPVAARPTRLRRVTRLPRGPFGQMAPAGPRMAWYVPPGADPITGAQLMTRRQRQRAAGREFRGRPENVLSDLRSRQPTARQARIAELVAANRARRAADAGAARRARIRDLAVANNVRRMAENVAPRVPRSQLFTQSDDYARGLNPFQRAARRFDRSRGMIPRLVRGMMTGFGRQTLASGAFRASASTMSGLSMGAMRIAGGGAMRIAGAAALALPFVKLTAAIAAAAAAASLLRKAFGGIGPLARGLGGGLVKIFDGFASRAKEVWPEMQQTVRTGWQGIVDAVKSGDLSSAWAIFADTAKAVFAQIMVVIGPFVDDVSVIFSDIGSMIAKTFWGAVDVATGAFSAIQTALTPVFNVFADVGDALFDGISSVMPSVGSMLSGIAEDASAAGNRIFEALSAGDIVKAWMAATTAISQMFARLSSEWEKQVAAPMRLAAVRGSQPQREQGDALAQAAQMMDDANGGVNRRRTRINAVLRASNPEQLEGLAQNARDSGFFNDPASAALLRDAVEFTAKQLKEAGIVTDEQRMAELNKTINELDAAYKRRIAELDASREENASRRRREADEAAAKVQAGAGAAAELRKRKDIEKRIGEATTQEELDKIQKELDDMTAKAREVTAREVGNPGNTNDEQVDKALRGGRGGSREDFQAQMRTEAKQVRDKAGEYAARAKEQGASKEELDAVLAARDRHASRLEAASTDEDVAKSVSTLGEEIVGITKRFRGAAASMTLSGRSIEEIQAQNAANMDNAERSTANAAEQQTAVNDARAKRAEELRVEAAEKRRSGDERAASKLEESAAALEQAVDAMESAEMQKKINAARQDIANQQGLRGQQAAAGGEAAAGAKRLDSVGGFMSKAFDRMGYGPNLQERQAKAAEETARGVNKLVGIVERNGGVFA